ncbi:toll-like receptor 22 [Rhinoraja longicauda]
MHFKKILLLLALSHYLDVQVTSFSLCDCQVHGSLLVGKNLKVLCYKMKLDKVPGYIPKNTENLDLSENRIVRLGKTSFDHLTQLQVLNISKNDVSDIAEETFASTKDLLYLNLGYNKLTILTRSMLDGLGKLGILLLNDNLIERVGLDAFAGLVNVRTINLTSNKLHRLAEVNHVFNAVAVENLLLQNNGLLSFATQNITRVPETLKDLDLSKNPFVVFNVTSSVLSSLLSLDLSSAGGNGSTVFHVEDALFFKKMKKLSLGGIREQPSKILALLTSITGVPLEYIVLNHLQLNTTDPLLLGICKLYQNLTALHLRGNGFGALIHNVFSSCVHLQDLDLTMNKLSTVSQSLFKGLISLRRLSLASNEFTLVPKAILEAYNLENLDLSFNQINSINPQDFNTLHKLKQLSLAGNKFTKIGSLSFSGLFQLRELELRNNYLFAIANFSSDLKSLNILNLRCNKLNSIEVHTFIYLQNLHYLNLIDNQISSLKNGSFQGLSNLTHLLLGSNKLTGDILRLDVFSGVESLKELQLFDNHIFYPSSQRLGKAPFTSLRSLHHLALNSQNGNGLQNIPSNFFDGLYSLKELHAGNNALRYIDPRVFRDVGNISYLDIGNNLFQSISPNLLHFLPALSELHLNKVGLENLDLLMYSKLNKLILLRAVGNQIGLVNRTHLEAVPSLTFLDLRDNPFLCACDNSWFLNWSLSDNKTQVIYFDRFTCAYPSNLKGKKLINFNSASCLVLYGFVLYISSFSVIIMTIMVSFTYHFWRWHVVYAYYLFLAFIYDKKRKGRHDGRYMYDAFVSYNTHDEQWVLDQLLPNLEGNNEYKLCLHHRDFEPGKPIIDNIVDSIYMSRKTICVISRKYLESEWCSKEIQVASFRLFDEQKDVLILVFLEDIQSHQLSPYHRMRKIVKKTTYLQWTQHPEEAALFWHKLCVALNASNREEAKGHILSGLDADSMSVTTESLLSADV